MALNKLFTGNIVDKNGVPINNVLIKGYHRESGVWSTVYDTGNESQYNINLGDGGFKTQEGIANVGDLVMLRFETKELNPIERQFLLYKINLSTADVYLQDVQLMDCQPCNVNGLWSLSSATDGIDNVVIDGKTVTIGRVGDIIDATINFNDDYSWIYEGALMEHRAVTEGISIFEDRLSVDSVVFDWTENDIFIEADSYRYTLISGVTKYTTVAVKATNQNGQDTYGYLYIQIRHVAPTPGLKWSPDQPSVADTFIIFGDAEDLHNRITNIEYKFNGNLVLNSVLTDYQWVQPIGTNYQETYTIEANLRWNDGFSDLTIPYSRVVEMGNLAPTFTLVDTVIGETAENDVKYTPINLTDPDGDDRLLELKWTIEYKTPFDNAFKVVHDPGYPLISNLASKEWLFGTSGVYRVTATAKDSFGLETAVSVINTFDFSASCTGSGKIKLNPDAWQMISIPVENKTVEEYFLKKVEDFVKIYNPGNKASDVIEVCNAYPGHLNKFLSFVPGFTNVESEHNFSHVINDGSSINEITGFWVKVKDYKSMTLNNDIVIEWNQQDS